MDNPTRWNITNSAQNIVSALVDPSKQFDSVFRREWTNTFAGFSKPKTTTTGKSKHDAELRSKLKEYVGKLDNRKHIKAYELKIGPTKCSTSQQQQQQTDDQQAAQTDRPNVQLADPIVPDIFMTEDFDLTNLETFNKVISAGRINLQLAEVSQSTSNGNIIYNQFDNQPNKRPFEKANLLTKDQLKDLQQNFTDYLDVTEERLASQISNRSGDFFQVMSSVDSVMDELSLAIKSVTNLRRKCLKLNESLILPNMKSIHMNNKRNNAQLVLDKMNEISYLCKVQPMIQVLLSASDFVGALDLIAKSRLMLHKDLSRVVSLRHLESQLVEIERMIGTMMQHEFLTLISSEWDGSSLSQQSSAASRLSKLFDYFANGYSELPERGSLSLLSLLQIQAEKFVKQFHEERKKRVESALDIEQWKVIPVPRDFQRLISMLVDKNVKISDIFGAENLQQFNSTQNGVLSKNSSNASISTMNTTTSNPTSQPSMATNDRQQLQQNISHRASTNHVDQLTSDADKLLLNYVKLDRSTFVIVNSVINLVRTVMDYCKCAHDIRSLSADLLERLFNVLQLYNSKTYHLVYSAGAKQVAGLKTITARSLVVSQRSLKLIILILPAIHRHFGQLLPDDKRLRRFDEIKASYEEHAAKIPERVREIQVKDVIDLELKKWEAKPPVPSAQFSAVAQHLTRLHDNIQDVLPTDELSFLFIEITKTFKAALVVQLKRLNISNDGGPKQWLVTQELTFYRISMSKLAAFRGLELNFDDIWTSLGADEVSSDKTTSNQQHETAPNDTCANANGAPGQ